MATECFIYRHGGRGTVGKAWRGGHGWGGGLEGWTRVFSWVTVRKPRTTLATLCPFLLASDLPENYGECVCVCVCVRVLVLMRPFSLVSCARVCERVCVCVLT